MTLAKENHLQLNLGERDGISLTLFLNMIFYMGNFIGNECDFINEKPWTERSEKSGSPNTLRNASILNRKRDILPIKRTRLESRYTTSRRVLQLDYIRKLKCSPTLVDEVPNKKSSENQNSFQSSKKKLNDIFFCSNQCICRFTFFSNQVMWLNTS